MFEKERGQILVQLLSTLGESISILDGEKKLLYGSQPDNNAIEAGLTPVMQDGRIVGWVAGDHQASQKFDVAALLTYLMEQESEKRALAAEVLDKYRELNLLYRLSEKLVTSPQPEAIARIALDEICPMVQVEVGMVVLKREEDEDLVIIASCGTAYRLKEGMLEAGGLIERVFRSGMGELTNDIPAQEFFEDLDIISVSLLCAPLKTEKHVLGVILMVSERSRQFTAGDLKLLSAIAMQTAPSPALAHLHQVALEKARMERELQMAHQVQADLLPRDMPELDGWQLAALWQPAREVSGDFYDFIPLPDGKLVLVIADVTDKGMPAALVMANTRSVLRAVSASANRKDRDSPGKLLGRANDLLCKDMPMNMFVTCLLVVFDPQTGLIRYANAGHPLPVWRTLQAVVELRATGFPLGIFPRVNYEEKETTLNRGDTLLMYSDGLIEAHNPQGEMFDSARLVRCLETLRRNTRPKGEHLIEYLMAQLSDFTGPDWEQEDDVTFVALERDLPDLPGFEDEQSNH